jgi:hypothetical protein
VTLRIEMQGLERLKASLHSLGRRVEAAAEAALMEEAGRVMGAAQKDVPVDTGRLRSSAFVRQVRRNQHRTDVAFGYTAPYAVAVHERPGTRHHHWLQHAADRVLAGLVGRVMRRVKAALKA